MAKEVADMNEDRVKLTKVAKDTAEKTQKKHIDKAKLHAKLAKLNCRFCNVTGAWEVTHTGKDVRYLRCKGCGRGSAVSIDNMERTIPPSKLKNFR